MVKRGNSHRERENRLKEAGCFGRLNAVNEVTRCLPDLLALALLPIEIVFSTRWRENHDPPTQLHHESSDDEGLVDEF